MNLDHLRYFVVTAETLHTGKAAKILNISQSAVSHSIAKLEEELGIGLFENVGKSIQLTSAGRSFALKAKDLLVHAASIRQEFQAKDLPLSGFLKLGAVHGAAQFIAPQIVAQVHQNQPGIIFEIYSLRSQQIMQAIADRTLDLGFCFTSGQSSSYELLAKKKVELKICVKPRHALLKAKKNEVVKELSALPCAAPKAFTGIEICEEHPALKKAGIATRPALIFDSYQVAAEYLRSSQAWTLIPDFLMDGLDLVDLEVPGFQASADFALIAAKGVYLPEAVIQQFLTAFS